MVERRRKLFHQRCLDPNIVATWTDSYERHSEDSGLSTGAVWTTVDNGLLLEIADYSGTGGLLRSLDASKNSAEYVTGANLQVSALQTLVCIKI